MKKLLAIAAVLGLSATAQGAVMFEAGETFTLFRDSRWVGVNHRFGFNFETAGGTVGFFFEDANWDWDSKAATSGGITKRVNGNLTGIRATHNVNKNIAVGLDVGSANLTQVAGAPNANLTTTRPFVDILGSYMHHLKSATGKAALHLDIGYRFLDLADLAAAGGGATEEAIKDLHGAIFNLGVTIGW